MSDFDEVFDALGPPLARIAASYEMNVALREELLQDIMLALYRAIPQLKDSAKLRTYAFRIAHNCCVDHVVKNAALPKTDAVSIDLPSDGDTPEQHFLGNERIGRLVGAVRRLELPYRQVMTLLLEDLSYSEIADTLGISVTNVGVRVNRAKTQIREWLQHD